MEQIASSQIKANTLSPNGDTESARLESKNEFETQQSKISNREKELQDKHQLHQSDNLKKTENKALSDKQFKSKNLDVQESFFKFLHKFEGLSSYTAVGFNLLGAVLMQLAISDKFKNLFATFTNNLTNMSFIPYGFDGMRIGWKERNNVYQTFGFFLESSSVWLSSLKTKYLIRGAGTGTDQIWVAADHKLKEKYGIKDGRFSNWYEGLIKVPEVCWDLLKEIVENPAKTLFSSEAKGHKALLSSIGSVLASIGFGLTGNEKIFGPLRDFSGVLIDIELLFSPEKLKKLSGLLFIGEGIFDFIARYASNSWARLTLNMLSQASSRSALMCYKNSDPNANRDKESLFEFKKVAEPISKLNNKAETLNVLAL